jgi:hypothetical protein
VISSDTPIPARPVRSPDVRVLDLDEAREVRAQVDVIARQLDGDSE